MSGFMTRLASRARLALSAAALLVLAACSSSPKGPQPSPLPDDPKRLSVREAWHADMGPIGFPLVVRAVDSNIGLATSDGTVVFLDTRTGEQLWRADLGEKLTAGVGHDGRSVAVVTDANDLLLLDAGKVLWRQRLSTPSFTPPLVAGGRVFILGADRSVQAFDGQSGRRIWNQIRTGESLVLSVPGILMPVGDTLVAGIGSRLVGMNPANGIARWELPLSSPRGTNDIERLVDLVGGVARQGSELCIRSFQSVIGCVDTARGKVLWTKTAHGSSGIAGDDSRLIGTEQDSSVVAWQRKDGERSWSVKALRHRQLSAPLLMGSTVVVGDFEGWVHFLAADDGAVLTRVATDGSAIAATPVLVGNTLVVVTRNGRVLGLRRE